MMEIWQGSDDPDYYVEPSDWYGKKDSKLLQKKERRVSLRKKTNKKSKNKNSFGLVRPGNQ